MRAMMVGITALAILSTAYAEENLNIAANNQTMQTQSIAEKNKATGIAFLEKNKNKSGVKSLADGLQYKVLKAGAGPQPTEADTVTVNYEGKLIDGTVFDSSYERGQPMTFQLSNVIPGWVEALKLMKTGSVWEIYIPSTLAYGEQGAPPSIGPNETLIFKVELLDVKKA